MHKEVKHTRIFDTLKARVTVQQAASHYGVRIGRNGMCRCPFHPDKTPSMKINETYYYCFGCHSTGDVIDFTAGLLGLSPLEAAYKLAADFGIDPNTPASAAVALPRVRQEESQREGHCASVLIEYERLLRNRQKRFAPIHPSEEWDDRFVSASHALPQVSYLIDCLYDADSVIRKDTAGSLLGDDTIRSIERWNAAHKEEVDAHDKAFAA
ncbi:MAG: CHC2 zinc finger domain-containing protein [bacterium]|nr:CHC2 zinc finger domain-containing protein [bacterium]